MESTRKNSAQTPSSSVLREAVSWCESLESNPADTALRAQFEQWRDASPLHRSTYRQVSNVAASMETARPAALARFAADIPLKRRWSMNALVSAIGGIAGGGRGVRLFSRPQWAFAASFLVVFAGWFLYALGHPESIVYNTDRGEIREIALEDGSHMTLDAASRAEVSYSWRRRAVRLVNGAAEFDVRHNPRRPFVVDAFDRRVTVHGTRFVVDLVGDKAVVAVKEGVVRLAGLSSSSLLEENILRAGRQARFEDGKPGVEVLPVDIRSIASWKSGTLVFAEVPLRQAVRRINRYFSKGRITIGGDNRIARIVLSGVFKIDQPEAVARRLAEVLDLDMRTTDQTYILLAKRRDAG